MDSQPDLEAPQGAAGVVIAMMLTAIQLAA
jgi:hypothetical protein